METEPLRNLVARLVFFGDFQELMNLYGAADVSLPPEDLAAVYGAYDLNDHDRRSLEEIAAAIGDDLLPNLDEPVTVPAELVELAARCAVEHGKYHVAVKALREAGSLDDAYERFRDYAMDSLASGDYTRAAWELTVAGRLRWASLSPDQRTEFVVGLGINAAELSFALGAQQSKRRLLGGRPLPDFPAWQTYGPLFHARCGIDQCVARQSLDQTIPLAVRYLVHDEELAELALDTANDNNLDLLKALVATSDPALGEYAERYEQAHTHYLRLREEWDKAGEVVVRAEQSPENETDSVDETQPPASEAESESPPDREHREGPDIDTIRSGLEEVQGLLLGRAESRWRNCLAQLAHDHPLSVFTVCTLRGREIDGYVAPVGEPGSAFLKAVLE